MTYVNTKFLSAWNRVYVYQIQNTGGNSAEGTCRGEVQMQYAKWRNICQHETNILQSQLWDGNKRRSISRSLLDRSRGSYVNTSVIFHKCHVYNNTMGGARLYLCRSTSMNAIWVHTLYMYCVLFKCRALAFVECLVDHFTIMHYSDHHDDQDTDAWYKNNVTKVTWRTNNPVITEQFCIRLTRLMSCAATWTSH